MWFRKISSLICKDSKMLRHWSVALNFDLKILMRSTIASFLKLRSTGFDIIEVYVEKKIAARHCLRVGLMP
jgi:hypothetical protein